MDIPEFIKKELEALRAEFRGLAKVPQSVREAQDQRLAQIRHDSMFKIVDTKTPNTTQPGRYPFCLYRQTTNRDAKGDLIKDERGDILVNRVYAHSEDDEAQKVADGWLVNPLGVKADVPRKPEMAGGKK